MKVLVALSGGVDSSVAAAELIDDGHEVVAVTMRLWGGESDTGCCSVSDVEDARRVAAQLGIEHHVFNFAEQFGQFVVEPYVADHAAGRTPNPCVECNRHLKFDVLLERADVLGFDAVATGHHARRVTLPNGTHRIARSADDKKDQSYVLHTLNSKDLERVLFPLGNMTKARVRERAAAMGLRTAAKPDSQDVCFITDLRGRHDFLAARTELHEGRIIDTDGNEVGSVDAVELITIGQRRGMGLSGGAARRFVVDVDVPARTVTVGPPERLLIDSLELDTMVWASEPLTGPVEAQCSAHGEVRKATIELATDDHAVVRFSEPSKRVAAGQSVVLYEGDTVVGGGTVMSSETPVDLR
jgi:tRNA-specific 2-thiouridylase